MLKPCFHRLITLLAAYLALVSIYRTTSWMVRTTVWMMKWGAILSALAAGAGWMMGNQYAGGNNVGRGQGGGIMPNINGMFTRLLE